MIMLAATTSACTHSSVPTVADQIVALTASNEIITIPDFTTTGGCSILAYQVVTSPDPAPGGSIVILSGSGPSIEVTQNGNIDSFVVAVSH